MREIKFRTWNTEKKQMDYDPIIASPGVSVYIDWCDTLCEEKNVIIMQYIGIKDKNGKEIYEDDIIDSGYFRNKICKIEFYNGCFGYYHPNEKAFRAFKDAHTLSEVIGNIHENPELLEKNNV